jgi:hypothetical protein
MRVRTFELRLLAAVLTTLWTIAAALVLLGYRPGGPIDLLVGIVAASPIPISLAGLIWPPAARGDRAFAGVVWLGLGAILLLIPSITGVLGQLLARGPQTLLPSLEAAYPWLLALAATSLFSGLGIARRVLGETAMRRRRLALGASLAVVATVVGSSLFSGAAIANDVALRDRPAIASRFGPTRIDPPPTACVDPLVAARAPDVNMVLDGDVDGRRIGSVELIGERSGIDGRWIANVASDRAIGQYGLVRVGDRAWARVPGRGWGTIPVLDAGGIDVDRPPLTTALAPDARSPAEDHGLEYIEGARARHCRIALDGELFLAAFPQVRLLAPQHDLHRWRGQLDYWVFGDGGVGQIRADLNGEAIGVGREGLLGNLRVTLLITDRNTIRTIRPPDAISVGG